MEHDKKRVAVVSAIFVLFLITGLAAACISQKLAKPLPYIGESGNTVRGSSSVNPFLTRTNTTTVSSKGNDLILAFAKLENNETNMVYSPLSVKYALCMLNEGAEENTKSEILNITGEFSPTVYSNINNHLSLANSLFINESYKGAVKQDYINNLKTSYNIEVQYDSFENASNINRWIEYKTFGILKEVVDDSAVKDARLTLINALAIDMEWEYANFQSNYMTFYHKDNSEHQTDSLTGFLNDTGVSYLCDKDITAITLPLKQYGNTQLEYIAIMPENKSLKEYIDNISFNDLNNLIDSEKPASETPDGLGIELSMPVYNYDYSLNLKEDLRSLGINSVFTADADLSGISDNNLSVSDVIHKADIDFSIEGIKAAAATVVVVSNSINTISRPVLEFNKPFMYIIRDKDTKEVWFVGTVYNP